MATITFENVNKSFGKHHIIRDLNLKIEDKKFTVLVGPSGCGKTTLLRMIAGIGPQTSGKVLIDNIDVTDIAPGKRGLAMVFQNYAIYPTMTVRENIEFGLKNNKVPKEQRNLLVSDASQKVGLSDCLERKPNTLSGGQRQRIALARAMVKDPSVFLMDEPLSNLDAKLRVQMRVELIELHHKLGATFVYVTHDQTEAMSMADRIILMDKGNIMQSGSPSEIYKDPDNVFTACFIGSPAMNIWELRGGSKAGFRPEHIALSAEPVDAFLQGEAIIATREMLGSETLYKIRLKSGAEYMVKEREDHFHVNDSIYFAIAQEHIYLFNDEGNRIRKKDNGFDRLMGQVKEGDRY